MSERRASAHGRGASILSAAPDPERLKGRNPEKKNDLLKKVSLQMRPSIHVALKKRAAEEGKRDYQVLDEILSRELKA